MGKKALPTNTISVKPIGIDEKISKIEKELEALKQKLVSLNFPKEKY